jgi:hypothetical protein
MHMGMCEGKPERCTLFAFELKNKVTNIYI